MGKTWCHLKREEAEIPFTDDMETRLHLEKILVLWGQGGRAEMPADECIANILAISYDTKKYIRGSNPDSRRPHMQSIGHGAVLVLSSLGVH